MSIITEIPIIATSSTLAGAQNVNDLGSSFDIFLDEPIEIPRDAHNCHINVTESTVWWTTPNISATIGNNQFYFKYNGFVYQETIPNGLYSVSDLSNALDRIIQTITTVSGAVTLTSDNATQKVELTINVADFQIDFTQSDTCRDILGFNSQLIPTPDPTTGVYSVLADNIAEFNSIDYYLLHSDLVSKGIRVNDKFTQTISKISIDKEPGSQIIAKDFNPLYVDADHLKGTSIGRIKFWLTDQDDNLVDTNGELFSCTLTIKYTTIKKSPYIL